MGYNTTIKTDVPPGEVVGTSMARCTPYVLTVVPTTFVPKVGDIVIRAVDGFLFIGRDGMCNSEVSHDGSKIRGREMRPGESVTIAGK